MTKKQPLDSTINEVTKELINTVNSVIDKLRSGMQEYLDNSYDMTNLLKLVEKLGINNINEIAKNPMSDFDYYSVLGLEKTASNSEIKERYINIINKIHPDISGQEMTFLSKLVNSAYEIIRKERGIK